MGSYFTDGLKDLTGEAQAPRRKSSRREKRQTPKPEKKAPTGAPAESPRRPKGLGLDPLKQKPQRRAQNETPADPMTAAGLPKAGDPSVPPESESLAANITALFSELGAANEEAAEVHGETSDVTESLLRAFNDSTNANLPDFGLGEGMDSELLGKALAENVMKQVTAKSIIYEPLKDVIEKYTAWFESDAVVGLSVEELDRNHKLLESMKELIHVYDTDPDDMAQIMELFAKSQSFGAPPEEVYSSILDPLEAAEEDGELGGQPCFQQ